MKATAGLDCDAGAPITSRKASNRPAGVLVAVEGASSQHYGIGQAHDDESASGK